MILSCSLSCLLQPLSPGTMEMRVSKQAELEPFPGRLDAVGTEEQPVPFPMWSHILLGVISMAAWIHSGFLLSLLRFLRSRTRKPWPGNDSSPQGGVGRGWGGRSRRQRGKAGRWNNPSFHLVGTGKQQVFQGNPGCILVTSSKDTGWNVASTL